MIASESPLEITCSVEYLIVAGFQFAELAEVSADPRERVEMAKPEIQRLATAHRKTGNCALLAICAGRILRLNRRNQTVEQITLKLREARGVLRREGPVRWRHTVIRERATVGHHDDHRRHFPRSDEIINSSRSKLVVTVPLNTALRVAGLFMGESFSYSGRSLIFQMNAARLISRVGNTLCRQPVVAGPPATGCRRFAGLAT